jgi:hypothetical protein
VAALDRLGYTGSIGVLGWDYGGDVYLKLERSLRAMHDISRRLERHRAWGDMPVR